MILLAVIFFILMGLNAFWDARLIHNHVEINHTRSTLLWGLVYLIFPGVLYITDVLTWPEIWPVCAVWPSVRWIGHDIILNLLRGKDWDYLDLGNVSSLSDKLLRKLPFHFIWVKLIVLGLFLGLIYVVIHPYN